MLQPPRFRGARRGLLVLSSLLAAAGAFGADRRKVIVDQDAFGGVNLQSILMVLQAQDVEVLGVTVESGDGWQKESVAQTLRMLELIGRTEVPVAQGATYPLINSEEEVRRWEALYGKIPYKGAWMREWPSYNTMNRPHYHSADVVPPLAEGNPTTKPCSAVAAEFLVQEVRKFPGEVSILALGPLTNIALAAKLDESFAANVRQIVIMGGSFNPDASHIDEFSRQWINRPRIEFNFWWDPEAARIALRQSWKSVVIVPFDATLATRLTPEIARQAGSSGTPASRYFARKGQVGFPLWDETAAAVWLDPLIVLKSEQLAVDVDIDHGVDYGATLSWPADFAPGLGEPVATVVRTIDIPKLDRMFIQLMRGPNPQP